MKIIFILDSLNNGAGIEKISVSLINNLVRDNYDITIFLLTVDRTSFFDLDEHISIETFDSISFNSLLQIRKRLKQINPNYIVGVSISCGLWACLTSIFTKSKVITWEHFHRRAGSKIGYYLRLITAICSYKQVVLTELDKKNYPKYISPKIIAIPNYTEPYDLSQQVQKKNMVLSIGRLQKNKRFDLLLNIWERVCKNNPQWELNIIGTGKEEYALKELSNALNLNNIKFITPQRDISKFYQEAAFLVTTSDFEGFGLTLIEAKSYHLPIIAFDVNYGPKVIVRNQIDGFLIPWNDLDSYADKMKHLMQNTSMRQQMGESGYQDYTKRFSKERICSMWKNILR